MTLKPFSGLSGKWWFLRKFWVNSCKFHPQTELSIFYLWVDFRLKVLWGKSHHWDIHNLRRLETFKTIIWMLKSSVLAFPSFKALLPRFWLKHRLGKAIKKPGNAVWLKGETSGFSVKHSFWDFLGTGHPEPLQLKNTGCWVAGFQDDLGPLQEALFPHELQAAGRTSCPVRSTCSCERWTLRFESNTERRQFWMHITIYRSCEIPCARLQMSEDDKMSSPPQRIELIFLANDYTGILQTLLRLMKMEEGFVPFQSYIGPVRIKQTKTVAHSPAWLSGLKVLLFSGAAIMWRNMHASLPGTLVLKLRILRRKTSKSRVRSEKSQSWCRICLSTSISCSWILYPVTIFLLAKTKCPNKCLQVLWNKTGPHVALPH